MPDPTQFCTTRYGRTVKSSQNEDIENENQSAESDEPEYQDDEGLEDNDGIYMSVEWHFILSPNQISRSVKYCDTFLSYVVVQVKREPVNEVYVEEPGKAQLIRY